MLHVIIFELCIHFKQKGYSKLFFSIDFLQQQKHQSKKVETLQVTLMRIDSLSTKQKICYKPTFCDEGKQALNCTLVNFFCVKH